MLPLLRSRRSHFLIKLLVMVMSRGGFEKIAGEEEEIQRHLVNTLPFASQANLLKEKTMFRAGRPPKTG